MPLKRDCQNAWVESASDGKDKVPDEAQIIVKALGSTLAWPKSYIKLFKIMYIGIQIFSLVIYL